MREHCKLIMLVLLTLVSSSVMASNNVSVKEILTSGKSALMVPLFAERAELSIVGSAMICEKHQIKDVLDDFFSKNRQVSAELVHHGGSSLTYFYIVKLKAEGNKNYRLYAVVKTLDNKQEIAQFRIDAIQ